MALPDWIDLTGGCIVSVARQRRKNGILPPPRFIVLGPLPDGRARHDDLGPFRPTLCAGTWVGGRALIDHGALGLKRLAELEAALSRHWGLH